jgi:hypothetical protein
MKNSIYAILVGMVGLAGCGGENGRLSQCNECRQQNAPIESAMAKSADLTAKNSPTVKPTANISESEINPNPGFSSIDLEQAARTQPSESLRKATDTLISQQESDI